MADVLAEVVPPMPLLSRAAVSVAEVMPEVAVPAVTEGKSAETVLPMFSPTPWRGRIGLFCEKGEKGC